MPYALRLLDAGRFTRFLGVPTKFHYLVEAAKDLLRKTASSSSPKERADALAAVVALVEKGTKCVQDGLVFGTKAPRCGAPKPRASSMDADIAKIKEAMLENWESIAPVIARQAPTASATAQELSWDRTVGKNAVSPENTISPRRNRVIRRGRLPS